MSEQISVNQSNQANQFNQTNPLNQANQFNQTNQPNQPNQYGQFSQANPGVNDNSYPYGNYFEASNNSYYMLQNFHPTDKRKEETPMTKQMKSQFSFFAPLSILYALFYAFCLYKNASGITYPFFVAGTLCYFFLSMKKLGVPYKKDSIFYVISIVLLGISNCCTKSTPILLMNKLGIFLLSFVLILHTIYQDKEWNFPKYIKALFCTLGETFACLVRPFNDLSSFFAAKKQKNNAKKDYFVPVLIGFAISIPMLFIIVMLLCSADAVFNDMVNNLLSFDISFNNIFRVILLVVFVFFASYSLLAALCKKTINEHVTDKKIFDPVIAITVTGMLSFVYLIFSMIQILYLFIGNMKLPEGYTYSSYARQGFFQLLAVCIINMVLVLFCISFFKDNIILKIILTIISGCTFVMIISSALRMFMYIERYNLTFLRIFVLWALTVIFLLMTGITIFIYKQNYPLFFYSVAIVTVFYIGLSFSHPDYWIARYNLNLVHLAYLDKYDLEDNLRYLSRLSADAAPILFDKNINHYLPADMETIKNLILLEEKYSSYGSEDYSNEKYKQVQEEIDALFINSYGTTSYGTTSNLYFYCKKVILESEKMGIRNFNFSTFRAGLMTD